MASALMTLPLSAGNNAGKKSPEAITIKTGDIMGRDSSKLSGRSFPKRLFMQKNSLKLGLQGIYLNFDSSDSQAFMMLTGLSGKASMMRLAPSFAWCYHNNQMLGIKFSYTWAEVELGGANISLLSDDMSFSLGESGGSLHNFGGAIYHRSYFGLDRRGRCALFIDLEGSYSNSRIGLAPNQTDIRRMALSFCPGFELFLMNRLSLHFEIGLADISYNFARNYENGQVIGKSDKFNAAARLNLSRLDFGLNFYL
ncbi:MAG: hypothetical protein J5764_05450 [Bacteroidales bacterium]|nr:hypothetical protein [Bacteroidales bacterium]